MNNPYQTLDVPADADPDTIKQAYRRAAQSNHPDKGGDVAQFQVIKHAYELLSDPERRAHYDRTGHDVGNQSPMDNRVMSAFAATMVEIMVQPDVKHQDMVKLAVASLEHKIKIGTDKKRQIEHVVTKLTEMLERFTTNGEANPVADIINAQLNAAKSDLTSIDAEMDVYSKAAYMFREYTYRTDVQTVQIYSTYPPGYSATTTINW